MGGDVVEKTVASHHRLHEQGLKKLDLFGECGKTQEFYGVHFRQTIGHRGAGWYSGGVRVR
jgi:hypothetical protein